MSHDPEAEPTPPTVLGEVVNMCGAALIRTLGRREAKKFLREIGREIEDGLIVTALFPTRSAAGREGADTTKREAIAILRGALPKWVRAMPTE